MYSNNIYRPNVKINIPNGVYHLSCISSEGKTRLHDVLSMLQAYGEPVSAYTYKDVLLGISPSTIYVEGVTKVIIIDRYDMYNGMFTELFNKCEDNTIVLVDCKSGIKGIAKYKLAKINMEKSSIEVIV